MVRLMRFLLDARQYNQSRRMKTRISKFEEESLYFTLDEPITATIAIYGVPLQPQNGLGDHGLDNTFALCCCYAATACFCLVIRHYYLRLNPAEAAF